MSLDFVDVMDEEREPKAYHNCTHLQQSSQPTLYSHVQHEKLGVGSQSERETCEDAGAQDPSNHVSGKRCRPRVPLAVVRLVGVYERA